MNPNTLTLFKSTPGAMSVAEGTAMHRLAMLAPDGLKAESGTHSGKSAIAAASGFQQPGNWFHLIDPDFKLPQQSYFSAISAASDGRVTPIMHHGLSGEILPFLPDQYGAEFAFVFLDSGEHTYELCRAECDAVIPRMVRGGILAFHDYLSQFTGVEKCYNEVLDSGMFEEIVIPWAEIIDEVERDGLELGNNTYHHPELANPTFLGALRKL